jgi:hypothetical protein
MSAIERAVKESIQNDRIGIATVSGMKPIEVFDEAKDSSPDFDNDGNELVFDWNEIAIGDDDALAFDIWAMSEENQVAGVENYFWRINVRIERD